MCSLRASGCTRCAISAVLAAQLQRRGDVVGHRHRRVVDELLVDHRDVALAHRHAGDVAPVVGDHAAGAGRVQPGHHAHQVVLPAWVAPSSTVTAPRRERQSSGCRWVGAHLAARCRSERQFHAVSVAAAWPRPSRSRHQARGRGAVVASRCRPSLLRRPARRRRSAPIPRRGIAARPRAGRRHVPSPRAGIFSSADARAAVGAPGERTSGGQHPARERQRCTKRSKSVSAAAWARRWSR